MASNKQKATATWAAEHDACETQPLLVNSAADNRLFPREGSRFWVLFWYSYMSALQSLLWMTWTSVPEASKTYLNVGDDTLDMFLNEGPIAFLVFVFAATWMLSRARGLAKSIILAAMLCFLASVLRCIPCWVSSSEFHHAYLAIVHVAQIINAGVAPLIVASPSYLSLLWFPETERNTATAVANVANAFGRAVGFFLGPAIVSTANDIPRLLYLEIGLAALPGICVLLYCPNEPNDAPSKAAEEDRQARRSRCQVALFDSIAASALDVFYSIQQNQLFFVAIAGGLQMGVYGAWSGILPSALERAFSSKEAGTIGALNTFAGIAGGMIVGIAADTPSLAKKGKTMIVVLSLAAGASFILLSMSLFPFELVHMGPHFHVVAIALSCASGLFRGGMDPLYFEVAADVAYPYSGGVAGSVLTFFYHLVAVISLSVPSKILTKYAMLAMAISVVVSGVVTLFTPMRYNARRH